MFDKHSMLKVIVPKPNATPVTPSSLLYNLTTDAINLPVSSFGFYVPVANSGDPIEATGLNTKTLKVIMRRNTANDRSPLAERIFEESQVINANCLQGVTISGRAARTPANNLHLVGGPLSSATQIPIVPEQTYRFQVTAHGDRVDWYNSVYNHPTSFAHYTAPDWTTTTYTPIQQLDITVCSLVSDFNAQSNFKAVAFAINSTGAGTTGPTISSIASLPAGSTIVIGYTLKGDVIRITLDKDMLKAIATLATTLPATAELRPYALPGSVNIPLTVQIAGTVAGGADHFAVMSLDEVKGFYDYRINTKTRITVGLLKGFGNARNIEVQPADEGAGQYHQVRIMYENNEDYNSVKRPRPYMSYSVRYPNELLPDATYDCFFIEHCHHRVATSGMPSYTPHTTVIAVVSFQDPTTPYFTGAPNPQKTYIQSILNAFNTNNNLGNPTLSI
jgi:hypothetical protein